MGAGRIEGGEKVKRSFIAKFRIGVQSKYASKFVATAVIMQGKRNLGDVGFVANKEAVVAAAGHLVAVGFFTNKTEDGWWNGRLEFVLGDGFPPVDGFDVRDLSAFGELKWEEAKCE